jgi:cysteine-rich repeat protein
MDVGTRDVCFDGVCVPSMCGDGLVDEGAGEDCDDGNAISGDGCESDCTFSCTTDAECETGNPCLRSQCSASHACTVPSSMSGAICDADADPSTRDICVFGNCQASSCGDGVQDPGAGEICDDGDDISGNGCESDCTWSCTSNAECDDGDPCDGTEYCNRTTHTCVHPGVFGLC